MVMNEWGDEVEYFGIRRSSPQVVYASSPAVHVLDALEMKSTKEKSEGNEKFHNKEEPAKDYDDDDDAFFSW